MSYDLYFNFCFTFVFSIWLYFPFNSFLFAGILRYYILYTLCIYINRFSRRTAYISSNVSQPTPLIIHTYTCIYIYIQFLLHVALVPSEHDDKWFKGAVAGNSILLWDLWPGRAKIPLFPLEVLVCALLVGAAPAPLWTIKKEINMHVY